MESVSEFKTIFIFIGLSWHIGGETLRPILKIVRGKKQCAGRDLQYEEKRDTLKELISKRRTSILKASMCMVTCVVFFKKVKNDHNDSQKQTLAQ